MKAIRIAVLMTCHNRRDLTIRCLERLEIQGEVRDSAASGAPCTAERLVKLVPFLVDDGSTDGTSAAVRARFSYVRLLESDGSLFWCGGTRKAWIEAAKEAFDAYLWLNDDTVLRPGAIDALLQVAVESTGPNDTSTQGAAARESTLPAVVVVGSTCDPETGEPTYGERSPHSVLPPPTDKPRVVQWSINGNLVLVSAAAHRMLGNLDGVYRHKFGDVDYGIRAQRAKIPVLAAPGFLAECRANGPAEWEQAAKPLRARWRALNGPKGISAREMKHFMKTQGRGTWWLSMLKLYWKTIFPARNRLENQTT